MFFTKSGQFVYGPRLRDNMLNQCWRSAVRFEAWEIYDWMLSDQFSVCLNDYLQTSTE